ncbi:MAG: hypothetical protein ABGW95_04180, partial [Candidatus Poseidoniia archaeon]
MLWAGPLFTQSGFISGWFDPASGEEGEGPPPGDALEGLILPPFRNCHTHLGDTLARDEAPNAPLAELVGPGGFKHRGPEGANVEADGCSDGQHSTGVPDADEDGGNDGEDECTETEPGRTVNPGGCAE